MIGNVALDVTIGLVFVYLLYSLYATVLMEILSSMFALRARNLSYAIQRMLMDEMKYKNYLQRKMMRLLTSVIQVMGKSANLVNIRLYDKFFKQPSIKYLCSGLLNNKPSYLNAENFSKGLIDAIKIDDADMTLLGSIEQGLEKGLDEGEIAPETWKQIQSLLEDSNNDLAKFKILLEQWYNDTMERATGWYKRTIQVFLGIMGFVMAVTFNIDTIAIVKRLAKDKDAREQMVKLATDFTSENETLVNQLKATQLNDSVAINQSVLALDARLDSFQQVKRSLEADMSNAQGVLGGAWQVSDTVMYYKEPPTVPIDHVQIIHKLDKTGEVYLLVHKSIDLNIFKRMLPDELNDEGELPFQTFWYKVQYVFTWKRFGGYFLTMLAISLGAPFWFDLLNKLVKLRTSKAVPVRSDAPGASGVIISNRATLNRVG